MRKPTPITLALAASMAAMAAAALVAPGAQRGPSAHERSHPALRLSGRVRGLYPGATRTLTVRVANLAPRPISLRGIEVAVGVASEECPGRALRVRGFGGRLRIPARGHRQVPLPVRMRRAAPGACAGARFPLRLRAWGRW